MDSLAVILSRYTVHLRIILPLDSYLQLSQLAMATTMDLEVVVARQSPWVIYRRRLPQPLVGPVARLRAELF